MNRCIEDRDFILSAFCIASLTPEGQKKDFETGFHISLREEHKCLLPSKVAEQATTQPLV